MALSTHPSVEFRVQSNYEVMHSPCTLELSHSSNIDGLTQRQRLVNKMFCGCPSKLDGEILAAHFRFWPK